MGCEVGASNKWGGEEEVKISGGWGSTVGGNMQNVDIYF